MTAISPTASLPKHLQPQRKPRAAQCKHCVIVNAMRRANLDPSTMTLLCESLKMRTLSPRETLFDQGATATNLFAVRAGRIKLIGTDETGRQKLLAVSHAGDLLGLEAAFGNQYETSAMAVTTTEVCVGSSAQVQALLVKVPTLSLDLARYLHLQLAKARSVQTLLVTPQASARLAGWLLSTWRDSRVREPQVRLDLPLRDIASALSLATETVCRAMAKLRRNGWIEIDERTVLLRDVEALTTHAGR